jgi:hypothetical protein
MTDLADLPVIMPLDKETERWLDEPGHKTVLRRVAWEAAAKVDDRDYDHLDAGHCPLCLAKLIFLLLPRERAFVSLCERCARGWTWANESTDEVAARFALRH